MGFDEGMGDGLLVYREVGAGGPDGAVQAKDGTLSDLAGADEVGIDVCLPGHCVR